MDKVPVLVGVLDRFSLITLTGALKGGSPATKPVHPSLVHTLVNPVVFGVYSEGSYKTTLCERTQLVVGIIKVQNHLR